MQKGTKLENLQTTKLSDQETNTSDGVDVGIGDGDGLGRYTF